ncbi:EamA family transporter [Marinomonas ostreistagni]|nr:EamA family transporter [Marinomonas ostreistagni]
MSPRAPFLASQAGPCAILIAAMLWGTTGTAASFASSVSPLAIGAFAMGIGGLLQVWVAWRRLYYDRHALWQMRRLVLLGALGVVIYPLAFYSAMHLAGVAIGTVVAIGAAPFFTALLEWLIGGKSPLGVRWCLSLLLGVVGIVLLTFTQSADDSVLAASDTFWGVVLGLIAAGAYALYTWLGKRLIEAGIHSKSAIGSMFLLSAALLLPSLAFTAEGLFDGVTHTSVALYMAFVPMFLGYLLFGYGLRTSHASSATLLTLFEPVIAALLAVTLVGEQLSAWGWLGMGLIAGCLLLQTWRFPKRPLQPSPPTTTY